MFGRPKTPAPPSESSPCAICTKRGVNPCGHKYCEKQHDMHCHESPRTFLKRIGGVVLRSASARWPWNYEDADVLSCRYQSARIVPPLVEGQSESEQSESEQPESEQPESEQPESEQPESEQSESEQPEADNVR